MAASPLPQLPEPEGTWWDYDRCGEGGLQNTGDFTAEQMQAYAIAARADLEVENTRLLEFVKKYLEWTEEENHHTKGTTFWERVEMCRELDELARAALERKA